MKSSIVIVILALACGYGLYTQYTGKQKRIADAENRARIAHAETDKIRPRVEQARTRFKADKAELDDVSENLPKKESEAALKDEAAKLDAAKAALAEELARPVPDPPVPAVQAAELEVTTKRLAELKTELDELEKENARLRRYYAAEQAALPKPKPKQPDTPTQRRGRR